MKHRVYDKPPCVAGSTLLGVAVTCMTPTDKSPYWYFKFEDGTVVSTNMGLWVEYIEEG